MPPVLTPKGKSIHEVVIIEYPRKGIWCFAFLTNDHSWAIDVHGKPMVNLFLPSTPNPTTGFYLLVPAEDVYRVGIKTDRRETHYVCRHRVTRTANAVDTLSTIQPS